MGRHADAKVRGRDGKLYENKVSEEEHELLMEGFSWSRNIDGGSNNIVRVAKELQKSARLIEF